MTRAVNSVRTRANEIMECFFNACRRKLRGGAGLINGTFPIQDDERVTGEIIVFILRRVVCGSRKAAADSTRHNRCEGCAMTSEPLF